MSASIKKIVGQAAILGRARRRVQGGARCVLRRDRKKPREFLREGKNSRTRLSARGAKGKRQFKIYKGSTQRRGERRVRGGGRGGERAPPTIVKFLCGSGLFKGGGAAKSWRRKGGKAAWG